MANKKSASKSKRVPSTTTSAGNTKVTRIKASDNSKSAADSKPATSVKKSAPKTSAKVVEQKAAKEPKKVKKANGDHKNILASIGGYFTGAWYELRQVLWPDRKNSWALTVGLIIFTLIFITIILLLDALFQYLFGLVLGK